MQDESGTTSSFCLEEAHPWAGRADTYTTDCNVVGLHSSGMNKMLGSTKKRVKVL